jgi:hypothetical protein
LIALPELRLSQPHAARGSLQKRSGLQADFEGRSALEGFTRQTHTTVTTHTANFPIETPKNFGFFKVLRKFSKVLRTWEIPQKVRFQR